MFIRLANGYLHTSLFVDTVFYLLNCRIEPTPLWLWDVLGNQLNLQCCGCRNTQVTNVANFPSRHTLSIKLFKKCLQRSFAAIEENILSTLMYTFYEILYTLYLNFAYIDVYFLCEFCIHWCLIFMKFCLLCCNFRLARWINVIAYYVWSMLLKIWPNSFIFC